MQPLVSIIMPVYNSEKYVSRCIDSVLAQKYTNWELIVVLDGPTDDSEKICRAYAEKDSRIKIISQPNGGLSKARNTGLDNSSGDYIGFLDSDDSYEPEMIITLLNACVNNDCPVSVCGRYDHFEKNNKVLDGLCPERSDIISSEECILKILTWNGMDVAVCDKLFDKDIWNDVRFPVGELNEDAKIIIDLISRAKRIATSDKRLYDYYHHDGSITMSAFSKNVFYCADHSDYILETVLDKYPQLEKEARYFQFKEYFFVYKKMILYADTSLPVNKERYLKTENTLKHCRSDKYYMLSEKICLLLIKINLFARLYKPVRKLIKN